MKTCKLCCKCETKMENLPSAHVCGKQIKTAEVLSHSCQLFNFVVFTLYMYVLEIYVYSLLKSVLLYTADFVIYA